MTNMPHLAYADRAVQLLITEARTRAGQGHVDSAVDSIECALMLVEQVANERVLIAALTATHYDMTIIEAVERLFDDLPDAPLDRLEPALARRNVRRMLADAMLGTVSLLLRAILAEAGYDPDSPLGNQAITQRHAEDIAWYLRTMCDYIESLRLPYHAPGRLPVPSPPATHTLSTAFMISSQQLETANQLSAQREAKVTIAHTAIRLRQHKDLHGSYPDPLSFEAPIDPYSGETLSYERIGGGFVLRSVSPSLSPAGGPMTWHWLR